MDLESLRGEINQIDDALVELYCRRMEIVSQVGNYKLEHHLPIFHPEREAEVIRRMSQKAGSPYQEGARVLFTTLMDVSKSYQHALIASRGEKNALRRQIEEALESGRTVPDTAPVALQGVEGAYSHEAACVLFREPQLHFYPQFEDVFKAVSKGDEPFGVLPIENSSAGSVSEVYDLLERYRLTICGMHKLPLRHCLLTREEVPLEEITDIYSHEQALHQCSAFLREHPHIRPHIYSNTAAAAQFVAAEGGRHSAAIASADSAKRYGLQVRCSDLQNAAHNFTRFIVVSRELILPPDASRISLSLTLPHRTGSLYRLITRFAMNSLNLTKLESRPLPNTDFEFLFYFDFDGSVRDPEVLALLCSLSEELGRFEFLGNY